MVTLVTIILVLAVCAATYVVTISALALALHWINPPSGASQPEPIDLREARRRGIA